MDMKVRSAELRAERLREYLRSYDIDHIIKALGVPDVLDAISPHDIADHICYLIMQRPVLSRSQILRGEVLALAARIIKRESLEVLIDTSVDEQTLLDDRERARDIKAVLSRQCESGG